MPWVEALGYLAAAAVVASIALRQVVRSRVLALIGAGGFVAYGVLSGAWPVAVAAVALGVANALRLRREVTPQGPAEISAITIEPHHPFLDDFLRANLPDIHRSQPEFELDAPAGFALIVTRHGLPAGVVIGRPQGTELEVILDYVTPRYRDSRSGRWLFGEGRAKFSEAGITRLVASPTTYEHRTYLETLGFRPEGARMVLDL